MEMLQTFIEWYLSHITYVTIFLLMMVESSFIPFPSEVVVPPAAYLATQGDLQGPWVLVFATLGALAGAFINYFLSLWLGRPIVHRFARSKVGHILLLSEEKVIRAEQFFEKRGAISTFVGRLMPGIRQLVSIPAGLSRMNLGSFALFTILGAGIWNALLYYLGWQVAQIPGIETKEQLIEKVSEHSHAIGIGILLAVLLFVVAILLFKYFKKKRNKDSK